MAMGLVPGGVDACNKGQAGGRSEREHCLWGTPMEQTGWAGPGQWQSGVLPKKGALGRGVRQPGMPMGLRKLAEWPVLCVVVR